MEDEVHGWRLLLLVWIVGCNGGSGVPDRTPSGDTGTFVFPAPPSDDPVLVVPDLEGLHLLGVDDGLTRWSRTWEQLVGPCDRCGGEGASVDGDHLLVSFVNGEVGGDSGLPQGSIARVGADGTVDLQLDGFAFPHDVVRDPADGSLIVANTSSHRLTWVAGDGSSGEPLREIGRSTGGFADLPNGMDRFDHEGRSLLLVSHRSQEGRITLWDITTPGEVELQWVFPPEGRLSLPHGPVFRRVAGQWWLLYAHTAGGPAGGSVGLAVTDDPLQRPRYVADLFPDPEVDRYMFLRGVELTWDRRLILTDSGFIGGASQGRVLVAEWPTLQPADPTNPEAPNGARGSQRFVGIGATELLRDGFSAPFEGWVWGGWPE